MKQIQIDFTGSQLRDAGMKQAADHADQVDEKWTDKAFVWLLKYLNDERNPGEFLAEDVREYAERYGFAPAPSARAWGSVMVRGAKAGVIVKRGYKQVSNPLAHCTPATLWGVIKNF